MLVSSARPNELKFQVSLLSQGGWRWVGVWGKTKLKLTQPPARVGAWAELGNIIIGMSEDLADTINNQYS